MLLQFSCLNMNMKTASFKAIFFHLLAATFAEYIRKRSVVFMRGSAIGYLVAVAVPIDLGSRNSFLAFNFEANYALPNNQTHRDLIDRYDFDGFREGIKNNITSITARYSRNVFSRKGFYETVSSYIRHFDLGGQDCLLRIICEIASAPLSDHNGLLGILLHILFLPTFSQAEDVPDEFYKAEDLGTKRRCNGYHTKCPRNLLDLISTF